MKVEKQYISLAIKTLVKTVPDDRKKIVIEVAIYQNKTEMDIEYGVYLNNTEADYDRSLDFFVATCNSHPHTSPFPIK